VGGSSELEARAARQWRLRRAATGRGAFAGLRVLVSASLEEPFKPEDIRLGIRWLWMHCRCCWLCAHAAASAAQILACGSEELCRPMLQQLRGT
jgi:hypothetical protein